MLNLRGAPRFTVLLRTAKLLADDREYICVLRDISATGAKIKLFHPLPACAQLQLELDVGVWHDMAVAWTKDDHVGLRFLNPVDVAAVIDAHREPRPRRQLRVNIDQPAVLLMHGEAAPAHLVNLSQQGACIETEAHLRLRERLRIESNLMPEMVATVCWRDEPRYGVVLEQGFQLDELARMLARLQDAGRLEHLTPEAGRAINS